MTLARSSAAIAAAAARCCAGAALFARAPRRVARTAPRRRCPRSRSPTCRRRRRDVHALIRKGGPFRYDRDGVVFGNREQLLPAKPRGYYHEYTVRTPGVKNRGARRIVCGGPKTAPDACYYTDDHYRSFRRIRE